MKMRNDIPEKVKKKKKTYLDLHTDTMFDGFVGERI
jgi:hypothetical protein